MAFPKTDDLKNSHSNFGGKGVNQLSEKLKKFAFGDLRQID